MTPRKAHNRRPPPNNQTSQNTQAPPAAAAQPSDYESDAQFYVSDNQQGANGQATAPPPTRTNEELNLSVLRRHKPSINTIVSLAPYAVVYIFSPTSQLWEKSGIEGSMFVCQLTPGKLGEERNSVFVLNRRGLDNFDAELGSGEDVELTKEYVILKIDEQPDDGTGKTTTGGAAGNARIYGLWIFSEPAPSSTAEMRVINAKVIKECANRAGESRKKALERQTAQFGPDGVHEQAQDEDAPGSVPMGRQISLKELFGQQREQDDDWSVKAHSQGRPDGPRSHYPPNQGPLQAGAGWPGPHSASTGQHGPGRDVLDSLFRKAGIAYQGGQGSVP